MDRRLKLIIKLDALQDCCGMGRALEAAFDLLACVWWVAGAAVLGQEADQANRMGIPQQPSRNAVVALSAICAAVFFILLIINAVLMKRMGECTAVACRGCPDVVSAPDSQRSSLMMGCSRKLFKKAEWPSGDSKALADIACHPLSMLLCYHSDPSGLQ